MTDKQFDYREAWLKMANKIRRQRDYWRNVAKGLRERGLIDKADQLEKCADDLDFVVQKSVWPASSEDKRIILHGQY